MSTGFPDEPGSREPGLDHLVRALTMDGHPDELAGRDAALAAFRAARFGRGRRRSFTPLPSVPTRLSAAAAALIAAFAGLTAAAYAKALPGPMQHIAYSMLAGLGVPDNQPAAGSHSLPARGQAPGPADAGRHGTASPPASASCPCPTPAARPMIKGATLSISAARAQLPANGWDLFAGKLTYHGHAKPGVRLQLLEQVPGAAGWQLAGTGVTGAHGWIRVGIPHLTQNATFLFTGPDGVRSSAVSITVIPRVLLWRAPAQPGTDRLVAAARFGDAGDAVTLQKLSGGSWQGVATQTLDANQRASFDLPAQSSGGSYYRVLLRATGAHGAAVSKPVFEPRVRAAIGAKSSQPHSGLSQPAAPGHGGHRHGASGSVVPSPVVSGPGTPGPVTTSPIVPVRFPQARSRPDQGDA